MRDGYLDKRAFFRESGGQYPHWTGIVYTHVWKMSSFVYGSDRTFLDFLFLPDDFLCAFIHQTFEARFCMQLAPGWTWQRICRLMFEFFPPCFLAVSLYRLLRYIFPFPLSPSWHHFACCLNGLCIGTQCPNRIGPVRLNRDAGGHSSVWVNGS